MAGSVPVLVGSNYAAASSSIGPRRDSIPGPKSASAPAERIRRRNSRGVRSQKSAPENVAVVNGNNHHKEALGSNPFGATAEELARTIARRQQAVRVAYQGVPGAYSEVAAMAAHPGCVGVPCKSYEDAIFAVECRRADRAVLPVESTLEGSMVRNYDLLLHHSLRIVKEVQLFVHYCLLVVPGVAKENVRRVISHPMALAHCGNTLTRLGLRADLAREPADDTAGAAESLLSNDLRDAAAIASRRAAEIYGLRVVARGIQDESWNVTRFLILARNPYDRGDDDTRPLKTSIVAAHREGGLEVLLKILSAFSVRGINLTKLEINPRSAAPFRILDVNASGRGSGDVKQFENVFYVDFEASLEDPRAQDVLRELRGFTTFIRVLGCYGADPKIYSLD